MFLWYYILMMVKVYGKLNLVLNILGKENDMHMLDMLNTSISLYDEIEVSIREDNKVFIDVVPYDDTFNKDKYINFVNIALNKFFQKYGEIGLDISIKKNIPLGAGLGGGSAPIVGILKALYAHIKKDPSLDELLTYGSDIPYMWEGGNKRVSNFGEIISDVNIHEMTFVIAKPNSGIDTKESYNLYDEIESSKIEDIDDMIEDDYIVFYNALEKASCILNKDIKSLKKILAASGIMCSMTGSGSAVFAVVNDENEADRILKLLHNYNYWAVGCNNII